MFDLTALFMVQAKREIFYVVTKCLFTCGLCNDAVYTSVYKASNFRMFNE